MNAYAFDRAFHVGRPRAAKGHMPFQGHRSVAEVDADRASLEILNSLGKDGGK